jgi:hypothetical protein
MTSSSRRAIPKTLSEHNKLFRKRDTNGSSDNSATSLSGRRRWHLGYTARIQGFRAEVSERIFSQTTIEGWAFDVEVLALARAANYKIGIIPAYWVNDVRSHVRSFDYLRVLGDTLGVRIRLMARKYDLS